MTPGTVAPPCSSIHGIPQARILEWVVIPFSRGSPWPRDWTQVSHIAGRFFITWATREVQVLLAIKYIKFWQLPGPHHIQADIKMLIMRVVRIVYMSTFLPTIRFALGGGYKLLSRRVQFSSVQFSCSVMSDSLQPHESQYARLPHPSPTPRVYSNSCPSSRWCHLAISSPVTPFSSFP